jgi:hypothetical protein
MDRPQLHAGVAQPSSCFPGGNAWEVPGPRSSLTPVAEATWLLSEQTSRLSCQAVAGFVVGLLGEDEVRTARANLGTTIGCTGLKVAKKYFFYLH